MTPSDALERVRRRAGLGQGDAAAALGVSQAMISYWERGTRMPSDRQLAALARLYRCPVGDLVLGPAGDAKPDLAGMLFRGANGEVPEGARRGIDEFVQFLDGYARLTGACDFDIKGMTQSPFPTAPGYESTDDARRKAEEVRAYLRRGLGPIGDIDEVCEMLGITVFRAGLGEDLAHTVSGAFLNHPDIGFSILVNLQTTRGRRRFTIAHELAHALFHSREPFVLSLPRRSPRERFADMFAGELLMPSEGLRRAMEEHGTGPRITDPADVVHLQRFFNVSYATCLLRLRQTRALNAERYEAFKAVRPIALAAALGYEISEEEFSQEETEWRISRYPRRFLRLVRHALMAQRISPMTIASMTGLTIDEVAPLIAQEVGPPDPNSEDAQELREHEAIGVVA